MTIRPVTSATLVSNLNQLNFEGKKKRNSNASQPMNQFSHKLAVPLAATVLAMSPMAKSSANSNLYDVNSEKIEVVAQKNNLINEGNVIKTKSFVLNRKSAGGVPYTATYDVNFVSNDNDDSSFESIQILYKERNGVSSKGRLYTVNKFNTYKFGIVSEDGSESNNFSLDEIEAYDTRMGKNTYGNKTYITDKPICDYIKSQIKLNGNNSDVKPNVIARKIRPSFDLNLQNVAPKNKIKDAAPIVRNNYKRVGSDDIEGANGQYKLTYYSMPNSDEVDLITLKKDGFPELAVGKNIIATGVFNSGDSSPVKLEYGVTELYDNNMKKYYISDKDLSIFLVNAYNNPVTSAMVFNCESVEREYICHSGVVMPLDGEDEYENFE